MGNYTIRNKLKSNSYARGKVGESNISLLLSDRGIRHIKDVYIKQGELITQIDLIIFHHNGVYVFEVKNFKDCIVYGDCHRKGWNVVYGSTNENIFNPVMQNYTHISYLKRAMEFDRVFLTNCVLFSNSVRLEVSNDMHNTVANFKDLDSVLCKGTSIYKQPELDSMYRKVLNTKRENSLLALEHLKGLGKIKK